MTSFWGNNAASTNIRRPVLCLPSSVLCLPSYSSPQPALVPPPLLPPPHPLPTGEMSTRRDKGTEGNGAASSGRQPNPRSVNRLTPTPQHTGDTASHPSSLGPTAARALALFCECLENSMSARLVMRSARGGNNISFACRELGSSAATAEQGSKKRPASSKKREKDKRRREIWLERRNCPSSAGPPLSSQQLQPQQQLQRRRAARITFQQLQPQHHLLQSSPLESAQKQWQRQLSEQVNVLSISYSKKKQPNTSRPTVTVSNSSISPLDGLSETPDSLSISREDLEDLTASPSMRIPFHTSSPTAPLAEASGPASAPSSELASAPASAPASEPASTPVTAPKTASASASALSYADAVAMCPTSPSPKAPPSPPPMSKYFPKEWWKVLCTECWRQSHGLQCYHCETCHRKHWGYVN